MSETYAKLFNSILRSSVWAEPMETKIVWITMLAMSDRYGYVGASVPGVASAAGVPVDKAASAIEKFLQPDEWSRSKEFEGRRIEVADRGWNILNYERFRDMRDEEARKEYERQRKRKQRAGRTGTDRDIPGQMVKNDDCPAVSAHAEASASASAHAEASPVEKKRTSRAAALGPTDPRFDEFWQAYGRKGSRKQTMAVWVKLKPDDELAAKITAAAAAYRKAKAGDPKFQRDAQRWLRDEGWNDEVMPGSSPTPLKVNANGRVVVEASKMHIPNMPLGSEFCDCPGCAAAKLTKTLADSKQVGTFIRSPHSA